MYTIHPPNMSMMTPIIRTFQQHNDKAVFEVLHRLQKRCPYLVDRIGAEHHSGVPLDIHQWYTFYRKL